MPLASAFLTDMRVESYTLFAFIEPMLAGRHGPFYEFRVYDLAPSGLVPTLKCWGESIGPRTTEHYSPVYRAFYTTDGQSPRYLHIWPYATLEARLDVRARSVQEAVWLPENSRPQLRDMHSTIYLPVSFLPLQ